MSRFVEIGAICQTTQGVQIPKSKTSTTLYDGGYRYLYIADFLTDKSLSFVDDDYDIKKVTVNDLVMANTGSPGRVFKGKNGILSNNLFKISFNLDYVSRDYLFFILSSNIFQSMLQKQMKGGIQKHLGHKTIARQLIPLPPLEEQKQIAAILDAADALRQKDQQLVKHYIQLSQSLFLEMFGDPFTNTKKFKLGTIRDLVSEVKYGTSAKANEGGKYPYLRMNNITYQGYMDYKDLKYINLSEKDKEKYLVKKGDVLFNRTNSKELVGKTGIYSEDEQMAIAGYLIRVRANDLANPYYIWGYLNSRHGKLILENMCKNIVGMANINAQELQNIKILHAPIEFQNQFAERVKKIEEQKQQAQANLEKSNELFNALLQKAFTGELTNISEDIIDNVIPFPNRIPGISTTDLHIGILALAYEAHKKVGKERQFGHVKAEKIVHMAESMLGIELDRKPIQDAAGPNDFQHFNKKVKPRAKKAGFFVFKGNKSTGYVLEKSSQFSVIAEKARNALNEAELLTGFENLVKLMLKMDTEKAEIFATVYAAWNNLLLDKLEITDEAIVLAARDNWHEGKLNIPRERFFKAIDWIRAKKLVPEGRGKYVSKKQG